MKLFVVAVRDRAIDGFNTPVFVPSLGAAIRSFADEVNKGDSQLGAHPEDFELWLLGQFDTDSGKLIPCDIEMKAVAKDLVVRKQ